MKGGIPTDPCEAVNLSVAPGWETALMGSSNIVHQYFKKEDRGLTLLIKVDPIHLTGTELNIPAEGAPGMRELTFDPGIFDDLRIDGFYEVNGMEFNLYAAGLI